MKQHEMPIGSVITLGRPGDGRLAVKGENGWRLLSSGDLVDPEEFRAGWDDFHPRPGPRAEPAAVPVPSCADPHVVHAHWCGGCGEKFMVRLLEYQACGRVLSGLPCPDCGVKDWRNHPPIPAEHLPAVHVARGMVSKLADFTRRWEK